MARLKIITPILTFIVLLSPLEVGAIDRHRIPGYGTGFIVSTDGYVLTNNHNVTGCKSVTAILGDKKLSTEIVGRDKEHDLALVKIEGDYEPAVFRSDDVALGEDVIVAGFPLTGLLTDLNITKGNVSGMRGIEGNQDHFQISAPLQPGNSGSPILDQSGNIVGMAIGNLDSKLVIDVYGEIPQNLNFGISSSVIINFLTALKTPFNSNPATPPSSISAIVKKAEDFTVLLECTSTMKH